MSMTKIHIISDLFLRYNEKDPAQEILPDVDLVVINGNIGHLKRSMLYAETLCNKYPDIQFIYNLGESELYDLIPKFTGEIEQSLRIRKETNASWPPNLHWPEVPTIVKCKNGYIFDVFCTYGFPKINSVSCEWKETRWARFYVKEILDDHDPEGKWYKPLETSRVRHGHIPDFATIDWINDKHKKECAKVKSWELTPSYHKLLVTHISPYNDVRCNNQNTSPYLIHLERGTWITSNVDLRGVNFLGSRLYGNPGRGDRQRIITV